MTITLHRRKATAVAAALALPLLGAAALAPSATAATSALQTVHGNAPSWARSANVVGAANPSRTLTVHIGLAPRDPASIAKLATAVSNPKSSSYRHYLSPKQYLSRFGPTDAQVAKVRSFLRGAGLKIVSQTPSRQSIAATGTVRQLDRAFHTTMRVYRHNGHKLRAPATAAKVPASLASVIMSVGGLTDSSSALRPNIVTRGGNARTAATPNGTKPVQVQTPCSTYYGEHHVSNLPSAYGHTSFPTANCGYEPAQERGAYGLAPNAVTHSSDGSGVTVAIIDAYASPTMASDAQTYSRRNGLPGLKPGQYAEYPPTTAYYDQSVCGSWTDEEALDVEAVHSMAPGARIAYVPAASCNDSDFLDSYDTILAPAGDSAHPLATIVSNSYGDTSDLIPGDIENEEHARFLQGAVEGVGFYFSSGDDGDAAALNNGTPQPQASANDWAVTAVGGTTLGVNRTDGYKFETGWGDDRTYLVQNTKTKKESWLSLPGDFYGGAGGGTSSVWKEPDYQKGIVPDSLANANPGDRGPGRVVPDIAANADPYTGFLVGFSTDAGSGPVYSEGSIGGTSLACPTIAGIMAVAQQRGGGSSIGFANPLLYSLNASAFHDVKAPTTADQKALVYFSPAAQLTRLVTTNHDSSLNTSAGYDNVTGRGSPSSSFITAVGNAG
jgi:subtilase family serine protease